MYRCIYPIVIYVNVVIVQCALSPYLIVTLYLAVLTGVLNIRIDCVYNYTITDNTYNPTNGH